MPPGRLKLGSALRTLSPCLAGPAVRAELHRQAGGELPATITAICSLRARSLRYSRALPRGCIRLVDAFGLSGGCISLSRGSVGSAGFRVQYAREMLLTEAKMSFGVTKSESEVWIGAESLGSKLRVYFPWLHSTVSALTGTKPNQGQLIVLTAFELECAPVGPVRNNSVPELSNRKRRAQPAGIDGRQVANNLLKEPLEVLHVSTNLVDRALMTTGRRSWVFSRKEWIRWSRVHRVTPRRCLQPSPWPVPRARVSAGFVLKEDGLLTDDGCC
jgi:hypothetical protein